jgi:hypothetical protein
MSRYCANYRSLPPLKFNRLHKYAWRNTDEVLIGVDKGSMKKACQNGNQKANLHPTHSFTQRRRMVWQLLTQDERWSINCISGT